MSAPGVKVKETASIGKVILMSDYIANQGPVTWTEQDPPSIYTFDPSSFIGQSGVTLSNTANASSHRYIMSDAHRLAGFEQSATEPTVGVDKAVRLAASCVFGFATVALTAYLASGVILIHPLLSCLLMAGSATFYGMSRQRR